MDKNKDNIVERLHFPCKNTAQLYDECLQKLIEKTMRLTVAQGSYLTKLYSGVFYCVYFAA